MLGCSVAAFRRATSNFYSGLFDSLLRENNVCKAASVFLSTSHCAIDVGFPRNNASNCDYFAVLAQ